MADQANTTDTGDLSGRTLGQYEIKRKLGQGGMATVYLAYQTSIGRTVAIKVMPPHFMHDETFMQRFVREVKVISDLQHPRVLPVYDYGQIEGRPYIVMAYMGGGTLVDLIRQGPMPLGEAVRFIEQIAEGLDHAHRKGVIHRDFKPSNVLLDEHGNAYLADFGIAKISEATVQLTGGGIIGTPAYMAPEMGREGAVTAAIDIYALGVTLYEMLTGEFPFHGETPLSVMMAHATRPVPDVRAKRHDLPQGVASVILKAMAKEPGDRYASAGEMAAALRTAAAGQAGAPAPSKPGVDWQTVTEPFQPATPPPVPTPKPAAPEPAFVPAPQPVYTPTPAPVQTAPPQPKKGPKLGLLLAIGGGLLVLAAICVGLFLVIPQLIPGAATAAPDDDVIGGATPTTSSAGPIASPTPKPDTVVTPGGGGSTGGQVTDVIVMNNSGVTICEVYLSPSTSEEWGDNQLGDNTVIDSGDSFTVTDVPTGQYDYQALDCDGASVEDHFGVELSAGEFIWNIRAADTAITIVNNSSYTLCYVYISSTQDAYWGGDHLGSDQVIAAGSSATVYAPSGQWDMRTETCENDPYWEQYGVDITGGFEWVIIDGDRQSGG